VSVENLPISDVPAEFSLLGHLLAHSDDLPDVLDVVSADDFFDRRHSVVFSAMVAVDESSKGVDLVSVMRAIRDAGRSDVVTSSYLSELYDAPAIVSARQTAQVIRDRSDQRRVLKVLERLVVEGRSLTVDPVAWIERVEEQVFAATQREELAKSADIGDLLDESVQVLGDRAKGITDYIPTSVSTVNTLIKGWTTGVPHIIAGRPGQGKTSYAFQELRKGAERGYGGVAFSLEMPRILLTLRMLSQGSGVDNGRIKSGKELTPADWTAITEASERLRKLPISIVDDPSITVAQLRSKFRREAARLRRKHGDQLQVKLVVVDYIQLMRAEAATREQEVARVSNGLRAFAKEFDVAVLALSQMNRDTSKTNARPSLSDFRESGAIEQDAATALFVYNPTANEPRERQTDERTIIVAKCRDGGATGDATCEFDGPTTTFFVPAHESHSWIDDMHDGLG